MTTEPVSPHPATHDAVVLPWRPITELVPELGGGAVLVCCGRTIRFARWAYGWTFHEGVDADDPLWVGMDGTEALVPQPDLYLPLSLPDGTPWPPPMELDSCPMAAGASRQNGEAA